MFDAIESLAGDYTAALHGLTAPLPPAAKRCMRAASCNDHQHAKELRSSAGGEHNRDHKHRSRRLQVKEKRTEARCAELAWESR